MSVKPKQTEIVKFDAMGADAKVQEIVLTENELGKGAFGQVIYGYDKVDPNQSYAVKRLDKKVIDSDERYLNNFINEVTILSEIQSPHVVALYNSAHSIDNYYLAMEYCNGGDL